MRILLSAGEVSGDVAGALLAREIRTIDPTAALYGLGGPRMAAGNVEVLCDTNPLGTVGVSEAFGVLPSLAGAFRALRARVLADPPDVAVLIANDIFNVALGRWLRRRGVRTAAWFPPQVWIWHALARTFARSYDAVLACFPEEVDVWSRAGAETRFVGHFLADTLEPAGAADRSRARRMLGLAGESPVVAVLPGSRSHEVARLGPALLRAAALVAEKRPAVSWVVPVAEPALVPLVEAQAEEAGLVAPGRRVAFVPGGPAALAAADLALVASGTASLEAALLGVPAVVVYRVSLLTIGVVRSAIGLGLMDSDTVALPNLVLGRRVLPELIQRRVNPAEIAAEALSLLDDPARRESVRSELLAVRGLLGSGGSMRRTAETVLSLAGRREPSADAAVEPVLVATPGGRS
ncbi:MAG TPA: lipid-A-disaccharide synthase [Thermoanaerobaculia bacterium]|nr:lipid-A-disaccharide synthase [Thermoanaerobaculia bacterium]